MKKLITLILLLVAITGISQSFKLKAMDEKTKQIYNFELKKNEIGLLELQRTCDEVTKTYSVAMTKIQYSDLCDCRIFYFICKRADGAVVTLSICPQMNFVLFGLPDKQSQMIIINLESIKE